MTTHISHLNARPFVLIVSGVKTIESRLFDDKRQKIQLGDEITYVNRASKDESVTVKVIALHRYPTFHDLFHSHDPALFGGESVEELERGIDGYYSGEDQQRYGVVGIEFVVA